MSRCLHIFALLFALGFGWTSSASATQPAAILQVSYDHLELQIAPDAAFPLAAEQHGSHQQPSIADYCQNNCLHNHCVSCGAVQAVATTVALPPASHQQPPLQLLLVTLFAKRVDYPPKHHS